MGLGGRMMGLGWGWRRCCGRHEMGPYLRWSQVPLRSGLQGTRLTSMVPVVLLKISTVAPKHSLFGPPISQKWIWQLVYGSPPVHTTPTSRLVTKSSLATFLRLSGKTL